MARRNKDNLAEALISMVARMPWYAGVALGVAGYFVLHRMALALAPPVRPGAVAQTISNALGHGLAQAGQYIVPVICLLGAAISAWRRHERKALMANVVRSDAPDILESMSWREFEMLVGEGFRQQGYTVAENFHGGPDGGIDLTLRRDGGEYLVQCK